MKTCPNCGTECEDNQMFCDCGHDFAGKDDNGDTTLVYAPPVEDEDEIDADDIPY